MMKGLQWLKKQPFSSKPIEEYLRKLKQAIMVRDLKLLIKDCFFKQEIIVKPQRRSKIILSMCSLLMVNGSSPRFLNTNEGLFLELYYTRNNIEGKKDSLLEK